ncbi:ecto-ADP-ribosyltransferase 5 isoform X3 [Equus asinus]|uniref:ecto-ADP-ribosyltransferase 5 isoform X3 n=1 Tax=Equus asinus TaxID=9793 RepID=UPI001D03963C|nr:ecto-ADP-ribosyltransferase 5 isoform X3 [Equus asinus]XP_044608799.1 ecto-ADP-ribosyltransferase 5 isoform X3 [Equus asinus]
MMLAALLIALGGLSLHTLWQVWPLSRRGLRSLTADNDLVWWLSTCVRGKECEDGAQAVPILPLGLAPDTFDDAYVGCAEEMEEKAAFLLKEEMARHALLRESWEAAQEAWEHRRRGLALPPGFKAQHGIAVMVYTNSSNTLYWELNQAVRTGGGSRESYMRHFPFKALHFYLTRALQLLRDGGGCHRGSGEVAFRGMGTLRFEPKRLGDSIRLGQFSSSSLDEAVARRFGNATFFSLRTCFGAPIHALSVFPKEREVLIPPYEVFLVTRFSQDGAQSLVTLQSYNQTCSHFNCAYLGGEKKRGCVSVPTGGQPDSSSNGNFSLLPWKTLLLAPGGFLLSGAGP